MTEHLEVDALGVLREHLATSVRDAIDGGLRSVDELGPVEIGRGPADAVLERRDPPAWNQFVEIRLTKREALCEACKCRPFFESGRQDLNLRPPGPQPGALPDCATPRDVQSGRRESNPP
jgi:hypothetical protein